MKPHGKSRTFVNENRFATLVFFCLTDQKQEEPFNSN